MSYYMDKTANFYSQPTYVSGGGFPVFAGSRRQRGGGIFGSLAKMVLPALKTVGKSVLRSAAREATGLASDVAKSALTGRSLKQSLRQHGLKRLGNVGRSALSSAMEGFSSAMGNASPAVASLVLLPPPLPPHADVLL